MIALPASLAGWPLLVVGFALGACVGSFLNVCIHRLPAEESVVRPRSRCPHCAAPIAWYDNLPLLSWLWLGARCRRCRGRISVRYPLVEAATGALAVLALSTFGPTPRALVAFVFTAALLLVTAIDLAHLFIPDEVSLPASSWASAPRCSPTASGSPMRSSAPSWAAASSGRSRGATSGSPTSRAWASATSSSSP